MSGGPLELLGAASMVALGFFMLAAPDRFRAARLSQNDRDLADRLARGSDAYFEELRTLQAYREPPRATRFLGALAVLLGGGMIVLSVTGAGR